VKFDLSLRSIYSGRKTTDFRASSGEIYIMTKLHMMIAVMFCCFLFKSTDAFGLHSSIPRINRLGVPSPNILTQLRSPSRLSASPADFFSTSMLLSVQAQLEAYEKQGVPSIVLPIIVSLVVGTILLPLTARKFQKDRNTRSLKDKGMQQEPEDAAGAYEKFYKINIPEEKEKI
jgi:hypothetical protein